MRQLTLILFLSFLSPALMAQFSGNGGFGGGSSGGGFGGFSSGGSSGGGFGSFGSSTDIFSSGIFDSDDDSSSSSGGYYSAPIVVADPWDDSLLNRSNNPAAEILTGLDTERVVNLPRQDFMALLVSDSPMALFLDLNGNGVNGDLMDGLLYNLYFGHIFGDDDYVSVSDSGGQLSSISHQESKRSATEKLMEGLKGTELYLTETLSDGSKSASLQKILRSIYAEYDDPGNRDAEVALESVLLLAISHPALAAKDGPILASAPRSPNELRRTLHQLHVKLGNLRHHVEDGQQYEFRGSPLGLRVSLARLSTVFGLAQTAMERGVYLSSEAGSALSASLYLVAFEIRRLKFKDEEKRTKLAGKVVRALMEEAPLAMERAAELTTNYGRSELEKTLVAAAPVLEKKKGLRGLSRLATSTLAAGAAVGAWFLGGEFAADIVSAQPIVELAVQKLGYVASPVAVSLLTNWLADPGQALGRESGKVQAQHLEMCELALKK